MSHLPSNLTRYSTHNERQEIPKIPENIITPEEHNAIKEYVYGAHEDLNDYLRGETGPHDKKKLDRLHNLLYSGLYKLRNRRQPIDNKIKVGYRMLVLPKDKAQHFINNFKSLIGTNHGYLHGGYSSYSSEPGFPPYFSNYEPHETGIILETLFNPRKHIPHVGHIGLNSELILPHSTLLRPKAVHEGVEYVFKGPGGREDRGHVLDLIKETRKKHKNPEQELMNRYGIYTFPENNKPITIQTEEV